MPRRSHDATATPTPRRPRKALLANLALLAAASVSALVVGEIVVRVFRLGPDLNVVSKENYRLSDDPILRYELVPGSPDGAFRISADGLRDDPYPRQKPAGVFRILTIGNSIAYGFGVGQNETLAKQIETMLRAATVDGRPRYEVINLGVTGYNIEQVVESLKVRGLAYEPDLILYCYCLNDPQDFSFELASLEAQLSGAKRSYREALLHGGRRLAERSRLYLLARYALAARAHAPAQAEAPRDPQWAAMENGTYDRYFTALYRDERDAERLRAGLDALREISDAKHVRIVTVIFPVFFALDRYRLEELHGIVRALCGERDLATYDLLSLYRRMLATSGPRFIFNALHPNGFGYYAAACYLVDSLTRDGCLPLAGPAFEKLRAGRPPQLVATLRELSAEDPVPGGGGR